jgi:hypothetical protein
MREGGPMIDSADTPCQCRFGFPLTFEFGLSAASFAALVVYAELVQKLYITSSFRLCLKPATWPTDERKLMSGSDDVNR